jgi:hypothetical protein
MENLEKQKIRDLKAARSYHDGLGRLRALHAEGLQRILGPDNMKRHEKFHGARLGKLRQRFREGIADDRAAREFEEQRNRLARESRDFLAACGADFTAMKALRESLAGRAETLFHRTLGSGFTGTTSPRLDGRVFTPPFPLESLEYRHYESDDSMPAPVLDTRFRGVSGELGSMTLVSGSGTGGWGIASATCRTGFLLVFRAPGTGRPVLSMEMEATGARCDGAFREEAGGAGASALQLGRLYGQVFAGVGEALRTYCPEHIISSCNSGGDLDWRFRAIAPGNTLKACFTLATPVPEGSWAMIIAGVETHNSFISGGCGVECTLEARFTANRLGVTIVE